MAKGRGFGLYQGVQGFTILGCALEAFVDERSILTNYILERCLFATAHKMGIECNHHETTVNGLHFGGAGWFETNAFVRG